LIEIEWFKAFHVYLSLKNQFQIFVFGKVIFFICPNCPFTKKNNITFDSYFQMSKILVLMIDISCPHLLLKFGPKTWKSLVTHTYPKLLCCQIQQTSPLGIKHVQSKRLQFKCRFCTQCCDVCSNTFGNLQWIKVGWPFSHFFGRCIHLDLFDSQYFVVEWQVKELSTCILVNYFLRQKAHF